MTIANLVLSAIHGYGDDPVRNFLISIVSLPLIYILVNEFIRHNARLPQMKGPSGLPMIGNIWDIRVNAAETYRLWSKKYGAVFQIMLGNIPIVVINSAEGAKAIFGQNAQALSSRPEFYTFHKVSQPGCPRLAARIVIPQYLGD